MCKCNQGGDCHDRKPEDCCKPRWRHCQETLEDAIEVIEIIYDLAEDFLEELEDEEDDCDHGHKSKCDKHDCDYDHKSKCDKDDCDWERKSRCDKDDCDWERKSRCHKDDCDCHWEINDHCSCHKDHCHSHKPECGKKCHSTPNYWGRDCRYSHKQECDNFLPRRCESCHKCQSGCCK